MQRINALIIAAVASIAAPSAGLGLDSPQAAEGGIPTLSAEEIVSRNVEARGGAEAWKAVETVRMESVMELGPGESAPLTLEFKRPSKVRVEFEVEGRKGTQAYDGETAWAVVSFGGAAPIRLSPEQSKELVQQADFEGPLIGYREKGHQIRLTGTGTVDGREVYTLELNRKDGETTRHDIEAETFLELRHSMTRSIEGRPVEISVRLGDYRKVGKLLIPHRVEQTVSVAPAPQVIRLESVELNVELPDERFAFPEGEAAS